MLYRTLTGLVAVSLLAGCQWLPAQTSSTPPTLTELPSGCQEEWPSLTVNACQTEAWVAFGLASQRGDRDWRDRQLARLDWNTAGHWCEERSPARKDACKRLHGPAPPMLNRLVMR